MEERTTTELLVRFENRRTFVVKLPTATLSLLLLSDSQQQQDGTQSDQAAIVSCIKKRVGSLVGWLPEYLEVSHFNPPFCNCRVVSGICGGKGGFGTLLKGQSRQASAITTKDFSACRDLQGRRLRHVNEAINYAVWKEWNDKVQAGTATLDEMAAALIHTDSGIAGWHLQLPAWAEVSTKKEHQRMKNLLRRWKRDQETAKKIKNEQREIQERQVASYVQAADTASAKLESTLSAALQQGLVKQKEANKRLKTAQDAAVPPTALLTLSGDAVLVQGEKDSKWRIQSDSNFCTVGIVLDRKKVEFAGENGDDASSPPILYFEIGLITGGIVQVGWATNAFKPNSENGDGVGDCKNSWGFDGSRSIKLHNEITEPYNNCGKEEEEKDTATWQAGDVVGCCCNCKTGEVSYSINGKDIGVAFQNVPSTVFPVMSCNPGEVVELRLTAEELQHRPANNNVVPVGDVMTTDEVTLDSLLDDLGSEDEDDDEAKVAEASDDTPKSGNSNEKKEEDAQRTDQKKPAATKVEPLDLDKYESVDELELLGLDRLKGALMAIGLKCGGTLKERAVRLFSVRGLMPEDYPKKLLAKKP